MGWKFPKRVPLAGQTISAQDVNEGLLPTVEAFGSLGESNFDVNMASQITRATELDDSISMKVRHSYVDESNNFPELYTAVPATVIALFASEAWQPIITETGMSTSGEAMYVLGTVQYAFAQATYQLDGAFLQLAIRLDGAVIPSTVVGDQDTFYEGEDMEVGMSGWCGGADVDAVIPLAPGTHSVELVGRVLVRGNAIAASRIEAQIHSRELLAVEMW